MLPAKPETKAKTAEAELKSGLCSDSEEVKSIPVVTPNALQDR